MLSLLKKEFERSEQKPLDLPEFSDAEHTLFSDSISMLLCWPTEKKHGSLYNQGFKRSEQGLGKEEQGGAGGRRGVEITGIQQLIRKMSALA